MEMGPKNVYIGRVVPRSKGTFESPWHNPIKIAEIKKEGYDDNAARQIALQRYEQYILGRPDMLARLPELSGKVLGCWCPSRALSTVMCWLNYFNHYVLGIQQQATQVVPTTQPTQQVVPGAQATSSVIGNIGKMKLQRSIWRHHHLQWLYGRRYENLPYKNILGEV